MKSCCHRCPSPGARGADLLPISRPHLAPAGHPDLRADPGAPARSHRAAQRHPGTESPHGIHVVRRNGAGVTRCQWNGFPRGACPRTDCDAGVWLMGSVSDGYGAWVARGRRLAGGYDCGAWCLHRRAAGSHVRVRTNPACVRYSAGVLRHRASRASTLCRGRGRRRLRICLSSAGGDAVLGPVCDRGGGCAGAAQSCLAIAEGVRPFGRGPAPAAALDPCAFAAALRASHAIAGTVAANAHRLRMDLHLAGRDRLALSAAVRGSARGRQPFTEDAHRHYGFSR